MDREAKNKPNESTKSRSDPSVASCLRGDLFRARLHRLFRDPIQQPKLQRLRRVNLLRGQKHFQSPCFPAQSRQPLRPAPPGDQSQRRAAMPEHSMWVRDAISTREREIEPAAHAISPDGGIRRSREVRDRIHQCLPHRRKLICFRSSQSRNLVQIRASREEMLVAGDDEGLGLKVGSQESKVGSRMPKV